MTAQNSIISGLVRLVQQSAFVPSRVDAAGLIVATAVPLLGSALWYLCHTVVEVSDDEQEMWIQMWLSQQTAALDRVRRLTLLSPHARMGRGGGRNRDPFGRRNKQRRDNGDEDKEEEGGRFAPPKLEFQPSNGIKAWAWFGWWPVAIASNPFSSRGGRDGPSGGGSRAGYTITVWFAPSGTAVVRRLLLQGRQAWLNKRSKRTEIWLPNGFTSFVDRGGFKIITKPSRPLSSVIVQGNTKEEIKQDAIHFLNAEKWYVGKGIPYRRGYLLQGPPGCGKTSLITALAGELRLPIVLVPLNDRNMDDRALMGILSEAPKDSIVLIEDIDCALPPDTDGTSEARMIQTSGRLPVTLSGLLNAIDGVSAQEGRLLFMTTNHPDRLDEALIRPGRVDVKYRLGKASKEAAGELFDQFFSSLHESDEEDAFDLKSIEQARVDFLAKVADGAHSFASLQGVLMSAKDDPALVATGMDKLLSSPKSDNLTNHSGKDDDPALVATEMLETPKNEESDPTNHPGKDHDDPAASTGMMDVLLASPQNEGVGPTTKHSANANKDDPAASVATGIEKLLATKVAIVHDGAALEEPDTK